MEGFLKHSEEAERNVRRQRCRQIACLEVDLHFLLLAELSAEASYGSSNTQILQLCRVQLVRQRLNIGGYLQNLLVCFARTAADFGQNQRVFMELLHLDSQ